MNNHQQIRSDSPFLIESCKMGQFFWSHHALYKVSAILIKYVQASFIPLLQHICQCVGTGKIASDQCYQLWQQQYQLVLRQWSHIHQLLAPQPSQQNNPDPKSNTGQQKQLHRQFQIQIQKDIEKMQGVFHQFVQEQQSLTSKIHNQYGCVYGNGSANEIDNRGSYLSNSSFQCRSNVANLSNSHNMLDNSLNYQPYYEGQSYTHRVQNANQPNATRIQSDNPAYLQSKYQQSHYLQNIPQIGKPILSKSNTNNSNSSEVRLNVDSFQNIIMSFKRICIIFEDNNNKIQEIPMSDQMQTHQGSRINYEQRGSYGIDRDRGSRENGMRDPIRSHAY